MGKRKLKKKLRLYKQWYKHYRSEADKYYDMCLKAGLIELPTVENTMSALKERWSKEETGKILYGTDRNRMPHRFIGMEQT